MSHWIKNYDDLLSHGNVDVRRPALDALEQAMQAADTYSGTKRVMRRKGDILTVGDKTIDLAKVRNLYVVGSGKGCMPIAQAVEEIVGDRIADGVISVKDTAGRKLDKIRVIVGGHPVPNAESLRSGQEIEKLAAKTQPGDLVIVCITGGCSALTVLPVAGVTLEEKMVVNKLLLGTGARIGEMNMVRKHISRFKGGQLIKMLHPATIVSLYQDTNPDFLGTLPWPDPIKADYTTFADAVAMLKHYEIWDKTPASVRAYLEKGLKDPSLETLKDLKAFDADLFDVSNPRAACKAAVDSARAKGLEAHVLGTMIEGESRHTGSVLAGIASELYFFNQPFTAPCLLASGGETTVTVGPNPGTGGPNQECVLGFALHAQRLRACLVSIDSEGTDGPTQVAGGIADNQTVARAEKLGIDLRDVLKRNDSTTALTALGDTIITGDTGSNVVNLRVLFVNPRQE